MFLFARLVRLDRYVWKEIAKRILVTKWRVLLENVASAGFVSWTSAMKKTVACVVISVYVERESVLKILVSVSLVRKDKRVEMVFV